MTQKKVTTTALTVDSLIEQGDVPTIIAKYVELTLAANKLRDYLLADPALANVLMGLVPQVPTNRGGAASTPTATPWNPLMATPLLQVPQTWDNLQGSPSFQSGTVPATSQPGMQEPIGTIHKDVPVTYEYPMDEYAQGGSQQAVMGLLQQYTQAAQTTLSQVPTQGYQGIDPEGGLAV